MKLTPDFLMKSEGFALYDFVLFAEVHFSSVLTQEIPSIGKAKDFFFTKLNQKENYMLLHGTDPS